MSRKILLRVAAFFILFTFVGHTIGALKSIPPEKVELFKAQEVMQSTMREFPFGAPKSIAEIVLGSNLCLSVYLLVAGIIFIQLSSSKPEKLGNSILVTNSLGLLAMAVLAGIYFFPLPAACTGIAGILGLITLNKS